MMPVLTRTVRRIRIAVDYAAMRADVRGRVYSAGVLNQPIEACRPNRRRGTQ